MDTNKYKYINTYKPVYIYIYFILYYIILYYIILYYIIYIYIYINFFKLTQKSLKLKNLQRLALARTRDKFIFLTRNIYSAAC